MSCSVYLRVPGLLSTEDVQSQSAIVRLSASSIVHVGEVLTLAVDTGKLHVFDSSTTQRL